MALKEFDWNFILRGWEKKYPTSLVRFTSASEIDIRECELRLGAKLPLSYRKFLLTTNGLSVDRPDPFHLFSTKEMEWFSVSHQDWIDAYVSPGTLTITDDEYFTYGDEQSPVAFHRKYLQGALQISDVVDGAVYLLNPHVVSEDGEWESWFFANWIPGAFRYRSFYHQMLEELAEE